LVVSFANKTGRLKGPLRQGSLHWHHVHGQAGVVRNGDPATLSASYAVSPQQAITSP
jgi:hypothetical protein